jgi:hypothetical protein
VADTPFEELSLAMVAGPPSPEDPSVPVPATVVIVPAGDTRRTPLVVGVGDQKSAVRCTATPNGMAPRSSRTSGLDRYNGDAVRQVR